MTKAEIDALDQMIRNGDIEKIASSIRCTMCGKPFSKWDLMLGDNLYDIFVGYGSKYDCTRLQFNFCTDCFDKILDKVIPESEIDPIVDSDYMDHCLGSDNHIHESWGFGGSNQQKSKTRVIVCGGRDFCDYEYMSKVLDKYLRECTNIEIVSGHAHGADTLGERYADEHGFPCPVFLADWEHNGRAAGFMRNSKMIDYVMGEKPLVVAFWDGKSHGTKDTLRKAFVKNIPCIVAGYGGYDINSMIENAIAEAPAEVMWATYVLGYYDGFHNIPESEILKKEWKPFYNIGCKDAKSDGQSFRHIEELGYKSLVEVKLELAEAVMIGEKPDFTRMGDYTGWEGRNMQKIKQLEK